MQTKQFQKRIENFSCEQCGTIVRGNGYTNHCPQCLYSKHVDIHPGDRAENCAGLMRPILFFIKNGKEYIQHQCTHCNFIRNNKVSSNDNRIMLAKINAGIQH